MCSLYKQGYWTLFGTRIKDAADNPVKAEGKSASVVYAADLFTAFSIAPSRYFTAIVFVVGNAGLSSQGLFL